MPTGACSTVLRNNVSTCRGWVSPNRASSSGPAMSLSALFIASDPSLYRCRTVRLGERACRGLRHMDATHRSRTTASVIRLSQLAPGEGINVGVRLRARVGARRPARRPTATASVPPAPLAVPGGCGGTPATHRNPRARDSRAALAPRHPSATVVSSKAWARPMIVETSVQLLRSAGRRWMNARSILSVSIGSSESRPSEEKPVPKSSIAIRSRRRAAVVREWTQEWNRPRAHPR